MSAGNAGPKNSTPSVKNNRCVATAKLQNYLISFPLSKNHDEGAIMSKKAAEHHKKSQEHHTHAARHHGEAAKHHEGGHHEKAAHHAHTARGHALHARHHSDEASMAHMEEHGKK
jgi:hypothetical protein